MENTNMKPFECGKDAAVWAEQIGAVGPFTCLVQGVLVHRCAVGRYNDHSPYSFMFTGLHN